GDRDVHRSRCRPSGRGGGHHPSGNEDAGCEGGRGRTLHGADGHRLLRAERPEDLSRRDAEAGRGEPQGGERLVRGGNAHVSTLPVAPEQVSAVAPAVARRGWPPHYTVVVLCFAAVFISYLDRTNISVASIAMKDQYGWTETIKGFVLSSFFIGYLLLQVV